MQKLRVRLWPYQTGLSPPVTVCVTDRSKAILLWWFFLFYVLVFKIFVLLAPYVCFHICSEFGVTEWPPAGRMAAHLAYDMFSWYRCLIVGLVLPTSAVGLGSFTDRAFS